MGIFTFKPAKVEVWFPLECAPEQLVSVVTTNRHFCVAKFFLWYPNLIICYSKMSYFRIIWTFAFEKCYSRGALNRFLVVFNKSSTNNKVFPWRNIFMRWVFNFCLFWNFVLVMLAC